MAKLSIIVPVFNEKDCLPLTFQRLHQICSDLLQEKICSSAEIIYVDDGSTDGSSDLIRKQELAPSTGQRIETRLLQFSRNFGHSAAVFAGLQAADGELVGIIDADLQDPPELLKNFILKLKNEKADVVYGRRLSRKGETLFKQATAWLFYRVLTFLSGSFIPRDTGDFRVMTREVRDAVVSLNEVEPFIRGLVAWVGFVQLPYDYERASRVKGETKYPFRRMWRFAIQAVMSFSSVPLRIAIWIGLLGMLASFVLILYVLNVWMEGRSMPGWTSLMIVFLFGQSLTLLLIGVEGLYLGRIHSAVQARPKFILKKRRE